MKITNNTNDDAERDVVSFAGQVICSQTDVHNEQTS